MSVFLLLFNLAVLVLGAVVFALIRRRQQGGARRTEDYNG
jgi:hypothetical protein